MLLWFSPWTAAQEDPPGRVGRLADSSGLVSWWSEDAGQWADAERNRPLTGGDRLSTGSDGRAELRVGSTVLRMGNSTELEVLRLDDERLIFRLHAGSLAVRVRSRDVASEIELVTAEARLLPLRSGHFRLDRVDDSTFAGSWRGEWRVDDHSGRVVTAGERIELFRESGRTGPSGLLSARASLPNDGFERWVIGEEGRDERSASGRYVSPEMTGAEELDRHGRWSEHPEFGPIWVPLQLAVDWAPYRQGRWAWVRPWGWTWIDEAPWGFAPSHYGRWLPWRGGWGWVPGAYVARPVYAPALVGWLGGVPRVGVSVQIGPTVGWVPLAPRDVYRPHHRHTPGYVERVNPAPPYRWRHPPGQVPTGPVMYGNQGVPNAVTVVSSDVLQRGLREPGGGRRSDRGDIRPADQGWRNRPGMPSAGDRPPVALPALPSPGNRGDFDGRPGRPGVDRPVLPSSPGDGRGPRDSRDNREPRLPRIDDGGGARGGREPGRLPIDPGNPAQPVMPAVPPMPIARDDPRVPGAARLPPVERPLPPDADNEAARPSPGERQRGTEGDRPRPAVRRPDSPPSETPGSRGPSPPAPVPQMATPVPAPTRAETPRSPSRREPNSVPDDERKRRPESQPSMRDRENVR